MSPEDFAELAAGVEAIRARGGVMADSWKNSSDLSGANPANANGRWPSNVVLSHADECEEFGIDGAYHQRCAEDCPVRLLDEQSGDRPGMSGGGTHRADYAGGMFGAIDCSGTARNDRGGASRFFFTSKASRAERDAGLDEFAPSSAGAATGRTDGSDGLNSPRAGSGRTGGARNTHPTPKRVDLMRYWTRMITPPGGLVLDPFCGSGSGGQAAMLEGCRFVGLELEPLHVDFARARIAHVIGGHVEREVKSAIVPRQQPTLFDRIGGAR
jgi:hypothetical protein